MIVRIVAFILHALRAQSIVLTTRLFKSCLVGGFLCSIGYMTTFGAFARTHRERLKEQDRRYTLRQVAHRVGVEPAYLSKIERGEFPPPSEQLICKLATELGQDPDVMLALAGKVSRDLLEIIVKRPQLMADLIRQVKEMPDDAVLKIVREVSDGDW